MKKVIALIVVLTLMLGCIPIFPALAESTVYDGPDPYNITVSVKGDLTSARGIAWQTGKDYTASDLQIIEHSDPATADFTDAEIISGTYSLIGDLQTNAHHVDVTGLKAGTTYCYRVGDAQNNIWSVAGSFKTDDGDDNFNFYYVCDSQASNEGQANNFVKTLEAIETLNTDHTFIMHGGDVVNRSQLHDQWYWVLDGNGKEYTMNNTYAPVAGNHDDIQHANIDYKEYYTFSKTFNVETAEPETQDTKYGVYYSYDIGNTHIAVVNSNGSGLFTTTSAQYKWLEQDLKNSDATYKIVAVHHPIITMGSEVYGTNGINSRKNALLPLFEETGVDLVLQAHDHNYQRTYQVEDGEPVTNPDKKTEVIDGRETDVFVNPTGPVFLTMGVSGVQNFGTYYDLTPVEIAALSDSSRERAEAEKRFFEITETTAGDSRSRYYFTNFSVEGNALVYTAYTVNSLGEIDVLDSFKIEKEDAQARSDAADTKIQEFAAATGDIDALSAAAEEITAFESEYAHSLTAEQQTALAAAALTFSDNAVSYLKANFDTASADKAAAQKALAILTVAKTYASSENAQYITDTLAAVNEIVYSKVIVVGNSENAQESITIDFSASENIAAQSSDNLAMGAHNGPAHLSAPYSFLDENGEVKTAYAMESIRKYYAEATEYDGRTALKMTSEASNISNWAYYIPMINGSPIVLEENTEYYVDVTLKVARQSSYAQFFVGSGYLGADTTGIESLGFNQNITSNAYPRKYLTGQKDTLNTNGMGYAGSSAVTTEKDWTTYNFQLNITDDFTIREYYAEKSSETLSECEVNTDNYLYFYYNGNAVSGLPAEIYIDSVTITAKAKIEYYIDGEIVSMVSGDYGEAIDSHYAAPEREGSTFAGWYTADGVLYESLTLPEKEVGTVDLYAKYVGDITLELNDQTGEANDYIDSTVLEDVENGTTITLPVPVRTNYKFTGWYKDAALTEKVDNNYTVLEYGTLYAGWDNAGVYQTVDFDIGSNDDINCRAHEIFQITDTLSYNGRNALRFNTNNIVDAETNPLYYSHQKDCNNTEGKNDNTHASAGLSNKYTSDENGSSNSRQNELPHKLLKVTFKYNVTQFGSAEGHYISLYLGHHNATSTGASTYSWQTATTDAITVTGVTDGWQEATLYLDMSGLGENDHRAPVLMVYQDTTKDTVDYDTAYYTAGDEIYFDDFVFEYIPTVTLVDPEGNEYTRSGELGEIIDTLKINNASETGYADIVWYTDEACTEIIQSGVFTKADASGETVLYGKYSSLVGFESYGYSSLSGWTLGGYADVTTFPYSRSPYISISGDMSYSGAYSFKFNVPNTATSNRAHGNNNFLVGTVENGKEYTLKFRYFITSDSSATGSVYLNASNHNPWEAVSAKTVSTTETLSTKGEWVDFSLDFTADLLKDSANKIYVTLGASSYAGFTMYIDDAFLIEKGVTTVFEANGGQFADGSDRAISNEATPVAPTDALAPAEGYVIEGWYTDADCTQKAETLTQGGTYYANWVDPTEQPEQPTYKMGDVDADGNVDTTDLALLKKYLADKENGDADKVVNGDVNSDGVIDTTDLAILKKILANIYEPDDGGDGSGSEDTDTTIDYEDKDIWTDPIGGEK